MVTPYIKELYLLQPAASRKINSLNCLEATIEEPLLGGQKTTTQTSSGPVSQPPVIPSHCRCQDLISNSLSSHILCKVTAATTFHSLYLSIALLLKAEAYI